MHTQYLARSISKIKTSKRHFTHVVAVHNKGQSSPETSGLPPNLLVHRLQGLRSHFDASGSIPYEKAVTYCMKLCNNLKNKPDVIHVHDFEGVHIASLLKAVFKIPIILTIHKTPKEWDKTIIYNDPKNFHLHALTQLELFDYFIAPSNAYKQHLRDHGVVEEKIAVIPHGIPITYLQSLNNNKVFARLTPPFALDDKKIIFSPIRLENHKGPDIFIKAAKIVIENVKDDNLYFIIAGSGSENYKEELLELTRSCGIRDKISIGPSDNKPLSLEEMATLYRKAHICVLPSRREGFGQVVLEAFVFRKPIIGANVGGISELIVPEENGLLFNRDEPEHLADQITRLLKDNQLYKTLAENGRRDVLQKHDAGFMAKKYYDLYTRCARENLAKKKGQR